MEGKGSTLLRENIVKAMYPGLNPGNVLCFAGAEDGIFCALLTLCKPEDHVIVLRPGYQPLNEIPRFVGCSLTSLDLTEENNWRIDIEKIRGSIQRNTKVIVINFPHNPTGQIIKPNELSQLLDEHGIWLFSDEVYRLLGREETEWAQPAVLLYKRALSLGVMSKAYGMAGLRIGWIACQDADTLAQIEKTKHYTSLCNSGPSEIISAIALRNQEAILKRNNEIVEQNLALLDEFFTKHLTLFSWVRPQGGCTGFVKYHGAGTSDEFCQELRIKVGILLLPGSVYEMGSSYFRIGFGRKNFAEALVVLDKFLSA